jgi:hypothetical protein
MADAKQEKAKTQTVIKFLGKPGLRLIQAEDWAEAGVKDHAPTLWGPENDWTVAKEDLGLNGEQYARIILADRGLREETITVEE